MIGAIETMSPRKAAFLAVDRYLLPWREREIARYFLDHLFVSHGLRERLFRSIVDSVRLGWVRIPSRRNEEWWISSGVQRLHAKGSPSESDRAASWTPALALLREFLAHPDLLRGSGLDDFPLRRSILLQDYDEGGRDRVLVFPFCQGENRPAAVVKLRNPAGSGTSLRAERNALDWVRSRLGDSPMALSVPAALAYKETPKAEILVLSHLTGRSAYWDQQNRFLPGRRVRPHLDSASDWLVKFHQTLGTTASAGVGPSHGDYWARNLLLAPAREPGRFPATVVVDWEAFDPQGPAHHDLFHFPITYAQNYPWRRYGRLPLPEAFRLGFLERTPVSHAVEGYFARYCAGLSVEPGTLEPLFRDYLLTKASTTGGNEGELWLECRGLLDLSSSVFSRCGL
jgi:hypothetical protein